MYDSILMGIALNKLPYVTIDGAAILVSKCRLLVECKYQFLIKGGMELLQKLIDNYREVENIQCYKNNYHYF